ncbi:hypothetical protein TVAG_434260 [Trichomonas vaginalis G3]|uniref:Conserved oligomeric Golgi complex subunit 2 n=1 Tax=Trichomonas vaginalis (strain ATCC PRA-98 / G3) TaxID=412133 RepID=A2DSK9_TRIV3|nr:conserved oligomeric Golgi complex component 2 family [Trichomonas vaginalis G3]EAY16589.1 hypothetical protein TVAG_434260 [Trichomonas vaginalis G3]KAI5532967.1 conserved oligomeric Golgi complex component 2 family [Trichomonas vaginalis G3]|eukprot:XP_001328812.1 hypothetical protein [Trichomonas vaginalis G3]
MTDSFFKIEDFQDQNWTNPGEFLLKHKDHFSSLNDFASALISYGEVLKARLTTIIHDDYTEFVTVAKQLIQLGDSMTELIKSFSNAQNAVEHATKNLQQASQPVKAQTEKLHKIRIEEAVCKLALDIVISLENIKSKLTTDTHPAIFLDSAIGLAITKAKLAGINQPALSIRIEASYNKIFKDFTNKLSSAFIDSVKSRDISSLSIILHATILSDQFQLIYKSFSDMFVIQEVQKLNISKKTKSISILNSLIDTIMDQNGYIHFIYENSLPIFDFILNSVWPSLSDWIIRNVEIPLSDAKAVHTSYILLIKLINEIEKLCRSKISVNKIHNSIYDIQLYDKLKLKIYPQLVSTELNPQVEQIIQANPNLIDGEFKVSTSSQLFDIIKLIFSEEYFILNEIGDFLILMMKICLVYKEFCQNSVKFKSHLAFDIRTFIRKLKSVTPIECDEPLKLVSNSLLETSEKLENDVLAVIVNETLPKLDFISTITIKPESEMPKTHSSLAASVFTNYNKWIDTEKSPLNSPEFASKVFNAVMDRFKSKATTRIQDVRAQTIAIAKFNRSSTIDPEIIEGKLKKQLLLDLECIATRAAKYDFPAKENDIYKEITSILTQVNTSEPETK